MKSLLLTVLIIAVCFTAGVVGLRACRTRVNWTVPIEAGAVAVVSGIAGMLPLIRSAKSDPGTLLQKAMAGSMLHMLVAGALSVGLIAVTPSAQRTGVVCWIFAGYWISLLAVIWRSRFMVIEASSTVTGSPPSLMKAH